VPHRLELPVEQASKVDLVINLKATKAFQVSVPIPVMGRADEVIEQGLECPLLAQSGHYNCADECPLSGVKRK
jgi:hypothetical protein